MRTLKIYLFLLLLLLPLFVLAIETIEEKTKNMKKQTGYFNFYRDEENGRILLEINSFEKEFLYVNALAQGLGSNDIGLDRGQLGGEHVVYFRKIGSKVLLIQPNYDFRAITENPDEKKAVAQSFAKSVLWGFTVEAQTGKRVLIDLTPFLLSDQKNVIDQLKDRKEGNYNVDASRSAIFPEQTKNFPKNSEFESIITYTGPDPGKYVKSVTPDAKSITLHQHFSFIELPDDNYKPRIYDPRSGYFGISYSDYATAISEPLTKQFIARHRLKKKNPELEESPPVEPIIYYLDRGAPEPIRSALMEGAKWWNQAFEVIGYKDAFQVKLLPENADPLDVRYNVIQWVHRSTRGWSYGSTVIDPRTGEIIKGHVSLGSLRVRQDFLIAAGLLAPYKDVTTVPPEMQEMALARLRQLAAHEVGHTLGLMHNFAASVNNRASVMDYPHPLIKITENNSLDLSQAYDTGIGGWDKVTIAYGYQDFPSDEDEQSGLKSTLDNYIKSGLKYISDSDARSEGGAHPFAHLWDNGNNAADDLLHILQVRRIALNNFSENIIRENQPFSEIENALVPIYLLHRYAVEAASKLIGGLDYSYAVRGDDQVVTAFVDADIQKKAFGAILKTLDADQLILDEDLLKILPPHPPGFERTRENFDSKTGVTFDPLSAAESAAQISLKQLLHPQRIARLIQYHERSSENPFIDDLFEDFFNAIFEPDRQEGLQGEIQRLVQSMAVKQIMMLQTDLSSSTYAKTWAYNTLGDWQTSIQKKINQTDKAAWKDHFKFLDYSIKQFRENPTEFKSQESEVPPGSPIGNDLNWNFNRDF